MKQSWISKAQRALCGAVLLTVVLGVAPQKAQAQWTVFDPSTWGQTVKIWNEDASMNIRMAQELAQGANLLSQTMQIYGLARTEAMYMRKGQVVAGLGFAAQHAMIVGQPGWDRAMMSIGGIANATMMWQQMANPNTSLQSRIALANSFGASTLKAVSDCYVAAQSNSMSLTQLQFMTMDMGGMANTAANQRNVANLTAQQQVRYHQCEENLQEQQAKLALLNAQQMAARDQATLNNNQKIDLFNASGGGSYDTTPDEDLRRTGMH